MRSTGRSQRHTPKNMIEKSTIATVNWNDWKLKLQLLFLARVIIAGI